MTDNGPAATPGFLLLLDCCRRNPDSLCIGFGRATERIDNAPGTGLGTGDLGSVRRAG